MSRKQSKPILLKVPHFEPFENISKLAFNLVIVGWAYFDKDNFDKDNWNDSLSYDIDEIHLEGGKDNIINVVRYFSDAYAPLFWQGTDIEKAVLEECKNVFNLELSALDPQDYDEDLANEYFNQFNN